MFPLEPYSCYWSPFPDIYPLDAAQTDRRRRISSSSLLENEAPVNITYGIELVRDTYSSIVTRQFHGICSLTVFFHRVHVYLWCHFVSSSCGVYQTRPTRPTQRTAFDQPRTRRFENTKSTQHDKLCKDKPTRDESASAEGKSIDRAKNRRGCLARS